MVGRALYRRRGLSRGGRRAIGASVVVASVVSALLFFLISSYAGASGGTEGGASDDVAGVIASDGSQPSSTEGPNGRALLLVRGAGYSTKKSKASGDAEEIEGEFVNLHCCRIEVVFNAEIFA